MDINILAPQIEDDYYSDGFLQVIEDHLTYLRTLDGVTVVNLTNTQCVKFQGDFFGLLNELLIDKRYHHAVLRVNGLFSSADFTGDIAQVVVPSLPAIDSLKTTYQTGSANSAILP